MLKVFEEENRLQKLLDVEAALALATPKSATFQEKTPRKSPPWQAAKYVKLNVSKQLKRR